MLEILTMKKKDEKGEKIENLCKQEVMGKNYGRKEENLEE